MAVFLKEHTGADEVVVMLKNIEPQFQQQVVWVEHESTGVDGD